MNKKRLIQFFLFFLIIFFLVISFFFYFSKNDTTNNVNKKKEISNQELKIITTLKDDESNNLIENIEYISKDYDGNEYIIKSNFGSIDTNDQNIILMKEVYAKIITNGSAPILITSGNAIYNNKTYQTNFSQGVTINYVDNKNVKLHVL